MLGNLKMNRKLALAFRIEALVTAVSFPMWIIKMLCHFF